LPYIDLPRALYRGRYMTAVARMEHYGVPIDTQALATLQDNWEGIKGSLIERIDGYYGVFDGTTFKADRWAAWLAAEGIPWPALPSGALDLKMETFRQMARVHPKVAPMHELRRALSQLKLSDLAVGADGRNRCLLSPFSTKTGRNAPSTSRFIFAPSAWLRGLIRPAPGMGLAVLDWAQQEFAIAAALSGDAAMIKAYTLGDPYMAFAILAGAAPQGATKETHGEVRALFKACVLAVQYLMGPDSLAMRIGKQPAHARDLLRRHHETFPRFWQWSEAAVNRAMLLGKVNTTFGWNLHVGRNPNPRSLANFPMQANGAEMLRLACCLATERGVRVVAPIHDALVIEAPMELLDEAIMATQASMTEASQVVLDGFELRTDVKVIRYPDRYMDQRGVRMWETVWGLIRESGSP